MLKDFANEIFEWPLYWIIGENSDFPINKEHGDDDKDELCEADQDVAGVWVDGLGDAGILEQLDSIGQDSIDPTELLEEHQHDGDEGGC